MVTALLLLGGSNIVNCTLFFPSGKRRSKVNLSDYDTTTRVLLQNNDGVLVNGNGLRQALNREQIKQLEAS